MSPTSWLLRACRLAVLALAVTLQAGPAGAAGAQGEEATTVVCPTCATTSLADALAVAPDGATIEVRGGAYPGGLVIDRPVHLVGSEGAVIDGSGQGTLVTIRGTDATLSGFLLRGTGDNLDHEDAAIVVEDGTGVLTENQIEDALFGIYLKNAHDSVLRDNVILSKNLPTARKGDGIKIWYSDNVVIEHNYASNGRDIILWYSKDGVVRNNIFDGGRYGLHLMFSDNTHIEANSLSANSIGLYIMYSRDPQVIGNRIVNNHGPSGGGIGLKDVDGAEIEGNRFVNNQIALQVDSSPREPGIENYIRDNVFAFNQAGIGFQPAVRHNTVTGNAFIDNTEQVAIMGRGQLRDITWAEQGRGNYWSDYAGYDADGDGIGDLPYRSQRLFESLVASNPLLRFFTWTPAASAIDFAARAMPEVRPEVKLSDPAPLMTPVAHEALPPLAPVSSEARAGLAAAGLALSGLAAAVYLKLRNSGRALPRPPMPVAPLQEAAP